MMTAEMTTEAMAASALTDEALGQRIRSYRENRRSFTLDEVNAYLTEVARRLDPEGDQS